MVVLVVQHLSELEQKRKDLMDYYKTKQSFRVSIGKSKWINYTKFNPAYNLREILKDEIVVEFDCDDRNLTWTAINLTAVNLYNAGIHFEIWNHEGKSPHLHIHNLPISHLDKDKLRLFKKVFIRNFVPLEFLKYVDVSLCGVHLVALEYAEHWKKCYKTKLLLNRW